MLFGDSVIPIGPQYTALDFFLWSYVKHRVYADNPHTLAQLKANIRDALVEILPEMCRKVI